MDDIASPITASMFQKLAESLIGLPSRGDHVAADVRITDTFPPFHDTHTKSTGVTKHCTRYVVKPTSLVLPCLRLSFRIKTRLDEQACRRFVVQVVSEREIQIQPPAHSCQFPFDFSFNQIPVLSIAEHLDILALLEAFHRLVPG